MVRQIYRTLLRKGKIVRDPFWDGGNHRGEPVAINIPDEGWVMGDKITCQKGTFKVLVLVPEILGNRAGGKGRFRMFECDWIPEEIQRKNV